MRIKHQRGLGVLENLNRQFPADRREVFKEDFERVTRFKVLEKYPDGYARADEHGGSAQDFGVDNYAWRLHGIFL